MKLNPIASLIRSFLRPAIIMPLPPDVNADRSAMLGLLAYMSNGNAASPMRTAITTAGTDTTLTGAQVAQGAIILASGASAGFTITLPTTAAIISALGESISIDSTWSKVVVIKNDGVGQTGTLTAGDGSTTINGTATIATNTTRTFLLTVTGAGTVTFDNLGSMSL